LWPYKEGRGNKAVVFLHRSSPKPVLYERAEADFLSHHLSICEQKMLTAVCTTVSSPLPVQCDEVHPVLISFRRCSLEMLLEPGNTLFL
jgi:hypothetical protein